MALVTPLESEHDLETKKLAEFFNETLGFCPNSILTMQRRPAISKAFINDKKWVEQTGKINKDFVISGKGASQRIIETIKTHSIE